MYRSIYIVIISLIFLSCSTTGRKAGSLSGAMEKASDDHHGDRSVSAVTEDEDDTGFISENNSEQDSSAAVLFYPGITDTGSEFKDLWLGLQFGTGLLSTKSFYGISSFSFKGNQFYRSRRSFAFELGLSYSPLQTVKTDEFDPASDEIVQALDGGIAVVFFGADWRYYMTPRKTFLGSYFFLGAKFQYMLWDYKNPIEINEYDEHNNYTGTETIYGDQLWGIDLNCGAAFNYIQLKSFILGIEFNPGIIIWGPETAEGFTNDVFAPFLYFKTNFSVMLK